MSRMINKKTAYLAIALTMALYLVPFLNSGKEQSVYTPKPSINIFDDEPYYSEGFVNEEKPGVQCHVSSVCPISDGKVGCVYYAGSREGAKDVAIYYAVYDEENAEWSTPAMLIDRKKCSEELDRYVKKVGNPMLFRDEKGILYLFYSSVVAGGWSESTINYKMSKDGGRTWGKSEKMLLSPFFNLTNNVKNKGLIIDENTYILPVYHELFNKFSQVLWVKTDGEDIRYEISKINGKGLIQPTLVGENNGSIAAFFRNKSINKGKYIKASTSPDMGKTWSDPSNTALPNPDSGFDSIRLSNGDYLMAINNSFTDRSNLTLVISKDRGETWRTLKILEDSPGKEYSYSSINKGDTGLYHLTYTFERKMIKHIAFSEAWIRNLENGGI